MSIEKIEQELRAAMGDFFRQPASHEGCRNALALFKATCSTSNIRALLDELSRLREVERRASDIVKLIELDLALAVGISRGYNLQPALDAAQAFLSEREGQE